MSKCSVCTNSILIVRQLNRVVPNNMGMLGTAPGGMGGMGQMGGAVPMGGTMGGMGGMAMSGMGGRTPHMNTGGMSPAMAMPPADGMSQQVNISAMSSFSNNPHLVYLCDISIITRIQLHLAIISTMLISKKQILILHLNNRSWCRCVFSEDTEICG